MNSSPKNIVWFKEVTKNDIGIVGGKGANLGEMTNAGIPVPQGFVVTADAYQKFLEEAGLTEKIRSLIAPLDANDSKQLQDISARVKDLISNSPMPSGIAEDIRKAYSTMNDGFVAVRSSATAEDLPDASFAGQQATFLNVQGEDAVLRAVQDCWASLFEARAIFYRIENKFDHFQVSIAVPVQKMVQSEASGVMFTVEPNTSDTSKIVIEAVLGLGEMIVSGDVTPDHFMVEKESMKIVTKEIKKQEWKLIRSVDSDNKQDPNVKVVLTPEEQANPKVTDEDVVLIAGIGKKLEDHYGHPQDVEWAKENGSIYIVQTRPVTTIGKTVESTDQEIDADPILVGSAASPGAAYGAVKIVPDPSQIDKVQDGDILVAEMTTPDFVPAMKRAAAIVTDRGGRTAHAAIVSRELGIPCVVGTENAMATLKDGQVITVNGSTGKVYEGEIEIKIEKKKRSGVKIETRTKLLVNLAQPELVERVAGEDVDGIGLLRAEFMVAQIGEHPSYMLEQGRGQEYTDKLADGLMKFAKAFYPRRVVYRTNDFKTNEYRALKGGEKYENMEENPMLGYRGASRYITDQETYKLELAAIKKVREQYDNLWVMVPFVRTVKELQNVVDIMKANGLERSETFKVWMMAEIPANVILLEKFLAVGIDGVSIGSNDLTQLTLGVDRDNEKLADVFDERNDAVLASLEKLVTGCKKAGVTCSICGQAPSVYPELTEKLVSWGITSVSVSPDMIDHTRELIADVEKKLNVK